MTVIIMPSQGRRTRFAALAAFLEASRGAHRPESFLMRWRGGVERQNNPVSQLTFIDRWRVMLFSVFHPPDLWRFVRSSKHASDRDRNI